MDADPTPRHRLIGRFTNRLANGPERLARAAADLTEAAAMRAVIDTPGAQLSLRVGNRIELFRARSLLHKEPETIEWLQRTIGEGSVFYDIGANIGVYTLYALTRDPSVRAICFEPGAATFARLCENLLDNGLAVRAIAFPVMASDDTGIAAMSLSDPRAGAAMHERAEVADLGTRPIQGSASIRLDGVVEPSGWLPPPTHLKIDVDGPELRVLRGASRVLASTSLRHVLVETQVGEVDLVDELLRTCDLVLTGTGRLAGSGPGAAQNRIYERR